MNQQLEKILSRWENVAKSVGSSTAKVRLQRDIDRFKVGYLNILNKMELKNV